METIMDSQLITKKFFRVRENMKKIDFIVTNSNVTIEIIFKAAILTKRNPYHNFGHEIGAAEQGIRLAKAEHMTAEEINLIALSLLFHDADHRGIVRIYDEMHAVELTNSVLLSTDTKIAGSDHDQVMSRISELI